MKNFFKHLKKVCTHKWWVFYYCCNCGMPARGILHDLSKFSPVEFFESVKYYAGSYSPIDKCKHEKGYSMAWFHHRGRNKHHWEYWVDNFEKGMTPVLMPYKYSVEMLCDFLGAGRAYMGEDFTYLSEYQWWINKREKVIMHPVVWDFVESMLCMLTVDPYALNKKTCKNMYFRCLESFESGEKCGDYKSKVQ